MQHTKQNRLNKLSNKEKSNTSLRTSFLLSYNDNCCILELIGAIKHTSDHFVTIIKIENKWYLLDDMQDETIIVSTIEMCLHLTDHDQS
jgi:hypothetical protein